MTRDARTGDRDGLVLCVGEALIALTPLAGRSLETADELSVSTAGAEANVAVHLARLGVPVRFAGRVGDDPLGRRLVDTLAREGVDVSAMEVDWELPTGLYLKNPSDAGTVVHYYRSGSAATRLDRLPPYALDDVDHIHLTGITPPLSESCERLVRELVADPARSVSFDVNYRSALWGRQRAGRVLLDLASRARTVFVGLDEAETLWGRTTSDAVRALLPDVELVVKNGSNEAVAYSGRDTVRVPALPVDVVEPVGAGDAFAAGYLASRRRGADLAVALRSGHVLAAGTLSVHADQGLAADPRLLAAAETGEGWPPSPW